MAEPSEVTVERSATVTTNGARLQANFMGWTLILLIVTMGGLAGLGFFRVPSQWDLISKTIDYLRELTLLVAGGLLGSTMPVRRAG